MSQQSINRLIFNPFIGYLPYSICLMLFLLDIPVLESLSYSILASLSFILISHFIIRRSILLFAEIAVLLALFGTLLFHFFMKDYIKFDHTYIVVSDIILIFLLMFIRSTKNISAIFLRKQKTGFDRFLINDYIFTGLILRNILVMYLLLLFCYKQITLSRFYRELDDIFYYIVPLIIFLGIYIYQICRIIFLQKKFNKEDWLPIMDQNATILGKIEKSIALKLDNKYWHPVIRIVLIYQNQIYLQDRSATDIVCPSKLDIPLEEYVTCDKGADKTILKLLSRIKSKENQSIQFLMNYDFEDQNSKRINYLYAYHMENTETLTPQNGFNGKFWSIKRIEEHFDETYFAEPFILEYEYIKNTVLNTNKSYLI